jgi:hypothetical protein
MNSTLGMRLKYKSAEQELGAVKLIDFDSMLVYDHSRMIHGGLHSYFAQVWAKQHISRTIFLLDVNLRSISRMELLLSHQLAPAKSSAHLRLPIRIPWFHWFSIPKKNNDHTGGVKMEADRQGRSSRLTSKRTASHPPGLRKCSFLKALHLLSVTGYPLQSRGVVERGWKTGKVTGTPSSRGRRSRGS